MTPKATPSCPIPAYDASDPDSQISCPRPFLFQRKRRTSPAATSPIRRRATSSAPRRQLHSELACRRESTLDSIQLKTRSDRAGQRGRKQVEGEDLRRHKRVWLTDPAALNGPLTDWMPRVLFLLLPLYALLLAVFHLRRRKDFYLVDHLVFSLSIHTFAFVALIGGGWRWPRSRPAKRSRCSCSPSSRSTFSWR